MNPEESAEIKNSQKELGDKINEVEKFVAVQHQINNNVKDSYDSLNTKLDEKVSGLERSLSNEIANLAELLTIKLDQIHVQTSKTNGSVIKNREDIECLQHNEIHVVKIGKDVEHLRESNKLQDIELGKLKDIVEPVKIAQRFPQTVRYTIIGFILVVILSMWGMLGFVKSVKKEIIKQEQTTKPNNDKNNTKNTPPKKIDETNF